MTVSIHGSKRIQTSKKSITIKGTASNAAGVKLVQFKAGKGAFKARLKPGANKIQVQAVGGNDVTSAVAQVKVIKN